MARTRTRDAHILEVDAERQGRETLTSRERRGGEDQLKRLARYARRETSEDGNPKGVTGMRQGRNGVGRKKASRGRETLKTQQSQARQTWRGSLSTTSSAEGKETPGKDDASGDRRVRDHGSNAEREANDMSGRSRTPVRGQPDD